MTGISQLPPQQDPQAPVPFTPADLDRFKADGYSEEVVQRAAELRQQRIKLVDDQQKSFMADFALSLKDSPDKYAEALDIAKRIGHPPAAVYDDLDVAREMAFRQKLVDEKFAEQFPVLTKWLSSDHDYQRIAHDDLNNLQSTAKAKPVSGAHFPLSTR